MTGPIYHAEIDQGTPEWHALRAGKFTASHGAVIMGGLDTSGLQGYVKDLAWERIYGKAEGGFKSKAMDRGHEVEPDARDWFAFERDVSVEQVAFVDHGRIANFGWSPDGLFNERRGAIEAKCPLHKAWMEVARTGKVPAEYRWQCRLACTVGRLDGIDFVAYHPDAGGIIVPFEVTNDEKDQIEARVFLLEKRVMEWVEILENRRVA